MDLIAYSKNWRLVITFYRPTREFWRDRIRKVFGIGRGIEREEDADFASCMCGDWKYTYVFMSIPSVFYLRVQFELLIRKE